MSSSNAPPELDHIIHLVRPGKLQECITAFEKLGFHTERGGVHADELTQNCLIVLAGVYIELIEFLEKPLKNSTRRESLQEWKCRREKHWWWGKKEGWIDWCLSGGIKDGRIENINSASKLVAQGEAEKQPHNHSRPNLVQYSDSVEGGRKALDGKELKWKVTFPKGSRKIRGTYPFFCEDITPRDWRVRSPPPAHPNKSQGLTAMTLLYYPTSFPHRLASLQLILTSSKGSAEEIQAGLVDLDPPPTTDGQAALPTEQVELYLSTPDGPPLLVRVKAAEDPSELQWLAENGEGLFELEISGEWRRASWKKREREREAHP
jgi:hypothetical protein